MPQLCLIEKGYSEDEYVIKQVDISECACYRGRQLSAMCELELTTQPREKCVE